MLFAAIASAVKQYPEDASFAGAVFTMPLWLQYCALGSQLLLMVGSAILRIFRIAKAAKELQHSDDETKHT